MLGFSVASGSVLGANPLGDLGADCTHSGYDEGMPRVIQIRDVPDEVHDALTEAAESEGLSLTRYMLRELQHLANRSLAVRANAAVIRETQSEVRGHVDREAILAALHEGRGD